MLHSKTASPLSLYFFITPGKSHQYLFKSLTTEDIRNLPIAELKKVVPGPIYKINNRFHSKYISFSIISSYYTEFYGVKVVSTSNKGEYCSIETYFKHGEVF